METEPIVLQEKPVGIEEVRCPECGHNITNSFNGYRISVFNMARAEYLKRQKRISSMVSAAPPPKTLALIKKYEQGQEPADFKLSCGGCEAKLSFIMYNTFTGETKMKDGRPLLIVRPNPKEVPSDF